MTAPNTATIEPIISNLSGLFLSTIIPHNIDEIIKNPPYAAYTLPKFEGFPIEQCQSTEVSMLLMEERFQRFN